MHGPPKESQPLPGLSSALLKQNTRAVQRAHLSSTGIQHGLRESSLRIWGQMNYLYPLYWLATAFKDGRQICA